MSDVTKMYESEFWECGLGLWRFSVMHESAFS